MQVPGGQVNPGLSFFRAIQGLVQRPGQPGESAQAQAVSRGTDPVSQQQRFAGDVQRAARQADPDTGTEASRENTGSAVEPGNASPIGRETAGGGRIIPRGSVLDITV
jgi:hypothetical protein